MTQHIEDPRILIFVRRKQVANQLAALLPNAVALHGSTPGFNTKLKQFREGKYKIAITVQRLNEGLDIPEINVVVFFYLFELWSLFVQQLGRGIRLHANKNVLLALDFAGTWQRVELVDKLIQRIRKYAQQKGSTTFKTLQKSFTVSVGDGTYHFEQIKKDFSTLVRRAEGMLTREELLADIMKLVVKLKRSPTSREVQQAQAQGELFPASAYARVFGPTHNAILEAAGLEINRSPRKGIPDRQTLIDELQEYSAKAKHTLSERAIQKLSKQGKMFSPFTYVEIFGSLPEAYEAAGLEAPKRVRRPKPSLELLVTEVQWFYEKFGHTPTTDEVASLSAAGDMYSPSVYSKYGGSFNNVLTLAKLPLNRKSSST